MQKVVINNQEFDLDVLPDQIKSLVAHIRAVDMELSRTQAHVAIYQTARVAYSKTLEEEMKKFQDQSAT